MKSSHNVRSVDRTVARLATQSVAQPTRYVLSLEAVNDSQQTDVARGLTQTEAARRLARLH